MADTPSCALYAGLKSLGRINNGNAAQILMAGNARYGGRLISERLTVPSFISREIVHAKPGDLSEPLFAPFEQSARQILNLIMQNRGSDPQSLSKVAKRYMEEQNRHAFYEEMLRALWGYMSDKFNIPVANLTKENVREELHKRGVSSEDSQRFTDIITRCDEAQYSPVESARMGDVYSEGVNLISRIESVIKR